jgi:hypothetical protein
VNGINKHSKISLINNSRNQRNGRSNKITILIKLNFNRRIKLFILRILDPSRKYCTMKILYFEKIIVIKSNKKISKIIIRIMKGMKKKLVKNIRQRKIILILKKKNYRYQINNVIN